MIEGLIESVSPDGVVHGWVRDTSRPEICHVQVLAKGAVVAEAMAGVFRRDLLASGHGHGHYGFAARLVQALPEGACSLALHLPALGVTAPMAATVPSLHLRGAAKVETLLEMPPGWTVSDVRTYPDCIDPAGNLARMGAARFVDSLYMFVLGRWPSVAEAQLQITNLGHGRITPADLLMDLLGSLERADLGAQLPSPFDAVFPFTFAEQ